MKVRNWRENCKDRGLWNEIVKQAKTHQELSRRLKKKKKKKKKKLNPRTEHLFHPYYNGTQGVGCIRSTHTRLS